MLVCGRTRGVRPQAHSESWTLGKRHRACAVGLSSAIHVRVHFVLALLSQRPARQIRPITGLVGGWIATTARTVPVRCVLLAHLNPLRSRSLPKRPLLSRRELQEAKVGTRRRAVRLRWPVLGGSTCVRSPYPTLSSPARSRDLRPCPFPAAPWSGLGRPGGPGPR